MGRISGTFISIFEILFISTEAEEKLKDEGKKGYKQWTTKMIIY